MGGIRDSPLAFALPIAIGSCLGSLFFFFFQACLFYMLRYIRSFYSTLLGRQSQDYMTDSRKEIFLKLER